MHAEPLDNTTAAMVARLPADPAAVAAAWVCLGSPWVGAFLPCYLEGKVPDRLARGGKEADADSPWWRMRRLLVLVARDFGASVQSPAVAGMRSRPRSRGKPRASKPRRRRP